MLPASQGQGQPGHWQDPLSRPRTATVPVPGQPATYSPQSEQVRRPHPPAAITLRARGRNQGKRTLPPLSAADLSKEASGMGQMEHSGCSAIARPLSRHGAVPVPRAKQAPGLRLKRRAFLLSDVRSGRSSPASRVGGDEDGRLAGVARPSVGTAPRAGWQHKHLSHAPVWLGGRFEFKLQLCGVTWLGRCASARPVSDTGRHGCAGTGCADR
jgi:hypothetical protein